MSAILLVHIAAGGLGLLSGAAAVIAAKGSVPHRIAGRVFLVSMLTMAITGAYIAALTNHRVTMLAAGVTGYLVASGWLIGSRRDGGGAWLWLSCVAGLAMTAAGVFLGFEAQAGRADVVDGSFVVPPFAYFTFATFAGIALLSDAWMLARGSPQLRGRMIQHLGRMCIALYIAASSFFSGQQDVFPEALRGTMLLQIPELLIFGTLLFWLGAVMLSKRFGPRRPLFRVGTKPTE